MIQAMLETASMQRCFGRFFVRGRKFWERPQAVMVTEGTIALADMWGWWGWRK